MAYQKMIIVGNLGRDPEMRYTADGTPVTSFSVAVNRVTNAPDGSRNEETAWFRVTAWRRTAEIAAQYLTKGRQVMVEGYLQVDKATGGPRIYQRNDGTYAASFELTADRLVLLGGRGEAGPSAEAGGGDYRSQDEDPGSIPF
jgi:single-strand DNA-binding protein